MNKALKTTLWILAYASSVLCLVLSYPLYLMFFGPIVFFLDGLILAAIAAFSLVYLKKRKHFAALLFSISLPLFLLGLFFLLLAMNVIHMG